MKLYFSLFALLLVSKDPFRSVSIFPVLQRLVVGVSIIRIFFFIAPPFLFYFCRGVTTS